jgi:hypothetical protein
MDKGVICIIDALGTKGIWNITDTEAYLKKIEDFYDILNEAKRLENTDIEFDYITFSDTIILLLKYRDFITPGNLPPFMLIPRFARIMDGVFSTCLSLGLFMRGAISCGDYIKKGSIIIGPAIDDAACLYEKAQMMGIVLTPQTSLLTDFALASTRIYPSDDYDYSQHLIKYDTPLKGNIIEPLFQINWPNSAIEIWNKMEPQIDNITRLKTMLGIRPIPIEAYMKHKNTISFFEYCSKFISA